MCEDKPYLVLNRGKRWKVRVDLSAADLLLVLSTLLVIRAHHKCSVYPLLEVHFLLESIIWCSGIV